ncbi:hypothetical protein AB0K43_08420, partial [Kitasatospora sp. NPDC049258]
MGNRSGHARHSGPGLRPALARHKVLVAGGTAALLAASVLAVSAQASGPPAAPAAAATAAAATPIAVQEWLYPGPAGSVTCSAPAEYADGRVKNGVLKPEYYTINAQGQAVLMPASDPAYACNGYSVA